MKKTYDLALLAKHVMQDRGLQPEFSKEVFQQLETIQAASPSSKCEDLRHLLWSSIDNENSRDLDQLTYAQKDKDGSILWIAVADVASLVIKDSPIDLHAKANTTSIYTPAKNFPMLPEKLSNNLTSLNENEDRLAIVIKIKLDQDHEIKDFSISQAEVHNYAKLTYNSIGAWLEKKASLPEKVKRITGLEKALLCQHEIAQILKIKRHKLGALTLEPFEIEAHITKNQEVILQLPTRNLAHELIEHFMIAANFAMAQKLSALKIPSLRRIVRIPKRWSRIVEIAASLGYQLTKEPDPKALETFLVTRKNLDPLSFPDLSLTVVKLLGKGEYVVETAQEEPIGHFGLALSEYTHSTAPNRRFPDLITQRQYKAALSNTKGPYLIKELQNLATHCTEKEDAAIKVERQMKKAAAAILLSTQIGTIFKGIITGAGEKGTWARIFTPPIEGRVIQGFEKLDVGDRASVKLASVDIPKGHINFVAVS